MLQKADFETLSSAEWVAVSRLVSQLVPHMPLVLSRRKKAALHHGPIDMRRVARSALRSGGEIMQLPRKMPRKQAMRVLALLDISGSMTSYSRMFLYFLHSLTRVDPRTKTLVFGTRLTDLSAAMRENDPDASIAKAVSLVDDWNGGTRIALNLERFNKNIAQRMAGSRTMILLVTDGLERDDAKAQRCVAPAQNARYCRPAGPASACSSLLELEAFGIEQRPQAVADKLQRNKASDGKNSKTQPGKRNTEKGRLRSLCTGVRCSKHPRPAMLKSACHQDTVSKTHHAFGILACDKLLIQRCSHPCGLHQSQGQCRQSHRKR
ncbi:MAG: VWA domain-containing protein [Betaproteobacteria bacterium]|nr:VWA domain-containing protein [Betaproteobacteria bacterium]